MGWFCTDNNYCLIRYLEVLYLQLHAAIHEFVLSNGPWLFNLFKWDYQDPSTSLYPISIRIIKTKPRSVNRKISFLKSFANYCLIERYLANDFTRGIESPKTDDKLPVYMTLTDLKQLFDYLEKKDWIVQLSKEG